MSTSTPTLRRRFKRYVVATVLLIVAVASVAWILAPLSSTEKFLIGTWHSMGPELSWEFRQDRTATVQGSGIRDPLLWKCNKTGLIMERKIYDVPLKDRLRKAVNDVFCPTNDRTDSLTIIDENTIKIGETILSRVPTR
jgi:hypothetical protein